MNMPFELLLGRKTFEIWTPYWPQHADMWPGVIRATKYVASNTVTSHEWQPSVFLSGDIAEKRSPNALSRAAADASRSTAPHIITTNDTKEKSVIKQVIINLPVADLAKSMAFFKALGFSHNPQASDDTGACIVVSDAILVMLLTHARFSNFTPKAICDTRKAIEVLLTLSCESRDQVDDLVAKAVAAGGSTYDKPEDYGFMYTHSFVDPDGHGWGLIHMSAMPAEK